MGRRLSNGSIAEMLGVNLPFAWQTSSNDVFSFFARTNRSSIFWSVLAILLVIGCVVYLFQWRYRKKIRADQEQLKTLFDLTETFVSRTDAEAIQQRIVQTMPTIADATHCFVLILNPAKQQLEYVAWSDKPPAPSVSLSAMSGPVTCFRNRALTDVPDAEQCPFVDKDVVRRFGQKTLLYVPLMLDRECVGVIEIEDRRRKRIFSAEQVSRVEHVANLSALALRMSDRNVLRDQVHRTEKAGIVKDLIESIAEQLGGHSTASGALRKARILNQATAFSPFAKNWKFKPNTRRMPLNRLSVWHAHERETVRRPISMRSLGALSRISNRNGKRLVFRWISDRRGRRWRCPGTPIN